MRKIATTLLAAAAMAAGTLLAAAPAQAASQWQTVQTNANWKCAKTVVHPSRADLGYQACLVTNAQAQAQVVMVVVNNSTTPVSISGNITSAFGADRTCGTLSLGVGERRGCFAPTGPIPVCLTGAGHPDPTEQLHGGTIRLTVGGVTKAMDSPRTECFFDPTSPW
ncbi:hypothetical protein ABT354_11985 [Streptomyces sp. NPDC000594]|uniref:hypothetical protein n=1 Tax=Streptomyces sp. NPDC000594 TaxID=3154261 RepID=UPI0033283CDB